MWHFSLEGDNFYGEFPDRTSAIEAGKKEFGDSFYVGEGIPPKPLSAGVHAGVIVESALDELYEDYELDCSDFNPTPEQYDVLQKELERVINQWVLDSGLTPQWTVISKPEKINADDK
jgi:hypothetical protein